MTEPAPGRRTVETFLDGLGRAGLFLGHLAQPPATALLARALRAWGVGSIPLVGLIFFMLGIVMEVQAEAAVVDYGLSNRLPELVARSLLRLAPILTGLLAAGRCGSGICAETGWMQLGGSLRALRTLRIQPERTLFPPLFWALTLAVPLLALGGLMVGAMGALLTLASPFSQARISPEFFLSSYPTFLTPLEGVTVALKGALMGAGIAVIAFTGGAQPKRSTADLTRAMTGGLVTAFLWVTLVDTLMSLFLPT